MANYTVAARGLPTLEVQAPNWIVALGTGLQQLQRVDDIERLACEVLANGTVIARDVANGTGYVVQRLLEESEVEGHPEVGPPTWLASIQSAQNAREAADRAVDAARALVPVESASVLLEEDGFLRFVATRGPHADKLLNLRIPVGTGVAGYCMQKRRSVVIGNAADDPRHYDEVDRLTGHVTRQIACLPVGDDERMGGVIEVLNLPPERSFSRRDLHRLQTLANALWSRLGEL